MRHMRLRYATDKDFQATLSLSQTRIRLHRTINLARLCRVVILVRIVNPLPIRGYMA